ncbi:MAG: aminotransferase class IV [Paracoccus sp. (in: a-proteobacteria)]|nr:aminotransferase class IV [Paracoccus sp. (in: a-proteobacteria)]MDO5646476.1 aminotransferase class IV [Paracoccus sp. (in: a-proteobacteria)]
MRSDAGRVALWPRHLARLERGCAAVGFPLDAGRVAAVMDALPGGVLRARLAVDRGGQVALTHAALPDNPPEWRVMVADQRLRSDDPWLRIKTTHRPAYDAARASLPDGVDEAVLLNEHGQICEGSITNVFVPDGDRLLTPPLSCGVLPGVLRAELLATGRAVETVLTPGDLAGRFFCGNALRGLIPARLVGA